MSDWDTQIHEKCGYENARCVCSTPREPSDPDMAQQLFNSVMEAIERKRNGN